jgi:hypothetical protein
MNRALCNIGIAFAFTCVHMQNVIIVNTFRP